MAGEKFGATRSDPAGSLQDIAGDGTIFQIADAGGYNLVALGYNFVLTKNDETVIS